MIDADGEKIMHIDLAWRMAVRLLHPCPFWTFFFSPTTAMLATDRRQASKHRALGAVCGAKRAPRL